NAISTPALAAPLSNNPFCWRVHALLIESVIEAAHTVADPAVPALSSAIMMTPIDPAARFDCGVTVTEVAPVLFPPVPRAVAVNAASADPEQANSAINNARV